MNEQTADMGEGIREWREDRPTIAAFEEHPYVARVEDVSWSTGRELLEISFYGSMPAMFTAVDEVRVVACWMDSLPGLWGRVLGEVRARKYGLGDGCITALVEVQR